jgi:membrane protein implicated in regulation of membrane protease activity
MSTAGGSDMEEPESWQWLWLSATFLFALGELLTPGSFMLLPFAIGAFVATICAFADVPVVVEWLVFLGVSIAVLASLRPLARRLNVPGLDDGIGSRRLLGQEATVLRAIPGQGELGLVRVGREEWRADSTTGAAIPAGTAVRVADVRGTHVVVAAKETLLPGDEARR